MSLALLVEGFGTEPSEIVVEGYDGPGALLAVRTDHHTFTQLGYSAVIGHPVPLKHLRRDAKSMSIEEAAEHVRKDQEARWASK